MTHPTRARCHTSATVATATSGGHRDRSAHPGLGTLGVGEPHPGAQQAVLKRDAGPITEQAGRPVQARDRIAHIAGARRRTRVLDAPAGDLADQGQ